MAQILDDNTVVPSFQGLKPRGRAEDTGNFTNLALRMGEVKDIIYPDDTRSISKRLIEYTVEVQHRDGNRAGTTSLYKGCLVANLFGGAADLIRYTLRKDDQSITGNNGIGNGSKVLLLCVNGQTTRAMILGGLRDIKVDTQTVETKSDGHNFEFEFNGVNSTVNKDGELAIRFRGATAADGSLLPGAGKNGPTTLSLLKDSSWECTVGSSISITARDDILVESTSGTWTAKASGQSFIKSAGLQVGAATDNMVLGSTYRRAEGQLHNQLQAAFQSLNTMLLAIGTQLSSAGASMVTPVTGAVTAAPAIALAGATATAAAGVCAQAMSALATFEAQAASYLSTKNKSD